MAWLWLALFGAGMPSLHAFDAEAGLPLIHNYLARDINRPAHPVGAQLFDVVRGGDGAVYVAHSQGILRFDGSRWRSIELPRAAPALALTLAADGRVYYGAAGQFGYLDVDLDGQWFASELLVPGASPDAELGLVWPVFSDGEVVYFVTSTALLRLRHGQVERLADGETLHYGGASDGMVLIETDRGLARLDGDRLRMLNVDHGDSIEILGMVSDAPGQVLLLTRSELWRLSFGIDGAATLEREPTAIDEWLAAHSAYAMTRMPNGWLAIGTMRGGVVFLDPAHELVGWIGMDGGLRDSDVSSLAVDPYNGLWLLSPNVLSLVEFPGQLAVFDERSGVRGLLTSVARDRQRLYLGTSNGLLQLQPSSTAFARASFERVAGADGEIFQLLNTPSGLLVIGSNGLMLIGEGGELRPIDEDFAYAVAPPLSGDRVLYVGSDDHVRLIAWQEDAWKPLGRVAGLEVESMRLLRVGANTLWVGSDYQGLYRLEFERDSDGLPGLEPRIERYDEAHGLPAGMLLPALISGRLHVITVDGLYRPVGDPLRFERAPEFADALPSLPGGRIHGLTELGDGDLYLSHGDRVLNLRRDNRGQWQRRQSPLSRIPRGSRAAAFLRETSGAVWVVADDALYRHDPSVQLTIPPEPQAGLEALFQEQQGAELRAVGGSERQIAAGQAPRSVRFEFSSSSVVGADATEYRHRLHGLDRDWSPWGHADQREYTGLAPGQYRFELQTRDVFDNQSSAVSLQFVLAPPWYRAWYSWLIWLLLVALLIRALIWVRVRSIQQRARHLERLVAKKTEELRESSFTDALTSLRNRHYFKALIAAHRGRSAHALGNPPLARAREMLVLLIDIDHFKAVNDHHGHAIGDQVLRDIAGRLNGVLRVGDLCFRWGGEEFLILAQRQGQESGSGLIARLLDAVGSAPVGLSAGASLEVRVSIGWALCRIEARDPGQSMEAAIRLADEALYAAKDAGRNQAIGRLPADAVADTEAQQPSMQLDGLLEFRLRGRGPAGKLATP